MRYRSMVAISAVVVAAMAVLAGVALHRLPAGTHLPIHWGADGHADRFADAGTALSMPVVLAALVSAAMAVLPRLEPLQDGLAASAPLYRTAWRGLLAMLAYVEATVAAPSFGIALPGSGMLVAVGLFLIVLGNALPKSRPGHFIGIRTPWTLVDPENWIATHRYAARIMIAGGAALIMVAVLPIDNGARASLVVATLLVVATTPIIYSYGIWRRTRRT